MTKPHRVQLSRRKGWRMPPNTVKVDRSNRIFGNPFKVGVAYRGTMTTSAEHAVARYQEWLKGPYAGDQVPAWAKTALRGKNLACWCAIGSPCHADILLELANL